jgi:uncharacterized glyoxalase superfamily protein PhnB
VTEERLSIVLSGGKDNYFEIPYYRRTDDCFAHIQGGSMLRFDLIGIAVKSMPTALAFYRRLGIAIPQACDNEEHVEVALQGGIRLAWDTVDMIRRFNPGWVPSVGASRIALAFKCDSRESVDRKYEELVTAGATTIKCPWDAFWGQRYAIVCDPDNNAIDLFSE